MHCTPSPAEATLSERGTPTIGVATTGTTRCATRPIQKDLNSHGFMVHDDLSIL
jgi:hypothetical protein